jgi:tetratricopeptide (TPR) repeat protein
MKIERMKKNQAKPENVSNRIIKGPDNPNFYYRRGVKLSQKGMYDLALSDFTAAISLKEDFAQAYYGRGTVYNFLHEFEKAKEDFLSSQKILSRERFSEERVSRN